MADVRIEEKRLSEDNKRDFNEIEMITHHQAMLVVSKAIRDVTGFPGQVSMDERLELLGIVTLDAVLLLKQQMIEELAHKGFSLELHDLAFDQRALVSDICQIVERAAVPEYSWRSESLKVSVSDRAHRLLQTEGMRLHTLFAAVPRTRTRTIECMPQLEIIKETKPGKLYTIAVFLNQLPAQEGADVQRAHFKISSEVNNFFVEVWFDCSPHFSVEDVADQARLMVETVNAASHKLQFTLRVIKPLDDGRPMFVSAFFRYQSRPSGKITRYLKLTKGRLVWDGSPWQSKTNGELAMPVAKVSSSTRIEPGAVAADVRVEVMGTPTNDGRQFMLNCVTPWGKWNGPWNLQEVAKDFIDASMQAFMENKGPARVDDLTGAGMAFWRALPKNAQELIWDALENGARTMSVVTEEPFLPWELIVPYKKPRDARQPLGVELQFGRWATTEYKSPPQHIRLKNGYVIAPTTSGLINARQEVKFLSQNKKMRFNPIVKPASYKGVTMALGGPPRDVIHFICHGKSAVKQTLELENPETINCEGALANKGFQKAFASGPLAFLNACQVGGAIPTLEGVGGFAHTFLALGASAVIAPLWAVQDEVALNVTRVFYTQALRGIPFSAIMKQVRARAYTEALDSYAAYCFYGDPMAKAV